MLEIMLLGGKKIIPQGSIKKALGAYDSILALTESGDVWVIGSAYLSGTGSAVTSWTKLATNVEDMWAGSKQALFRMGDGKYMFVGENLIFPGAAQYVSPTDVSSYLTYPAGLEIRDVSFSPRQVSFIFTTGQYANMGANNAGGLGIGSTVAVRKLTMRTNFTNVVKIVGETGGYDTTLVLLDNGEIWGVGKSSHGQLLETNNTNLTSWKKLSPTGVVFVDLVMGARGWIGVSEDDDNYTLYCAGDNSSGQLGAGSTIAINKLTSVQVIPKEQGFPTLYFGNMSSRYKTDNSSTIRYTGTGSGKIQGGGPTFTAARTEFTDMPSLTLWGEFSANSGNVWAAYILINGQLYGVGANESKNLLPGLPEENKYVFMPLDTTPIK